MMSVIVMTVIGDVPADWQPALGNVVAPPGFSWRFVPEGPLAVQVRSILRIDARAVVVWVGTGDAIDRAAKFIERLLRAGLPVVVAIAEIHDPSTESALREAGAVYLCAHEAQERLCNVMESILDPPSRSTGVRTIEFSPEIKMDDS
jgi:hypothetical protein